MTTMMVKVIVQDLHDLWHWFGHVTKSIVMMILSSALPAKLVDGIGWQLLGSKKIFVMNTEQVLSLLHGFTYQYVRE